MGDNAGKKRTGYPYFTRQSIEKRTYVNPLIELEPYGGRNAQKIIHVTAGK